MSLFSMLLLLLAVQRGNDAWSVLLSVVSLALLLAAAEEGKPLFQRNSP
jgi:hypothetical protein